MARDTVQRGPRQTLTRSDDLITYYIVSIFLFLCYYMFLAGVVTNDAQ